MAAGVLLDCVYLPVTMARGSPGVTAQEVAGQWFLLNLVAAGAISWWYFGRERKPSQAEDASHYGSHGTARFARRPELRRHLRADGPGLIFGKEGGKYLILPPDPKLPFNQNVTIIGGSGSRKTRAFVQPNNLQTALYGGESLIEMDPKGENYARSAALLRDKGYQVHLLNLLYPEHSDRWNPLDAVESVTDAADLAVNLVANTINPNRPRTGDPFWDNAEQSFITALVLYIKEHRPPEEQHMASVLELGTDLSPDALDHIFLKLPRSAPARRFYRSFLRAEEKIRAGVVAGLGSRLQLWNSPEIAHLTSGSDFQVADFGLWPHALFLVVPDSKATYAPLLALFWQQALERMYKAADLRGGRLPCPVRCRMDEIANCGYIPDYEKKKSTMRSRGISTEEIWQSLGQIKNRYPAWAELLANSDHLLFLGANEPETAQHIAQLLGQTTIRLQSTSNSESDRSTTSGRSDAYGGRPLLTVDEVLRLPADEALLIPRGSHPARIQKADFTEHPLAKRIELLDHKEYQPPARPPLVITDVAALWAAANRRAPDPAPAAKNPEDQQPQDPTDFLDKQAPKSRGGNE